MYIVESSRLTEEPIMLLDGPIGYNPDEPGCIDGALFQRELLELDNHGYKCIKIYINSPGGSVADGFNICNAILQSKTPVDTYNTGMAASMGGIIFMTGRKRVMSDYALLMIHAPSGGDDQKILKAMRQSTITILSAKCNMSDVEIGYVMDRETWFSSAECFEKGFCTEVIVTSMSNQKRMPSLGSVQAVWKEAKNIQNNIFNTEHMAEITPTSKAIGLSLVAAYLELSVDASETSVLNAVKSKMNTEILARNKAEDEASAAKKAMDKMKADLDEMTEKYNAMVSAQVAAEAQAKKMEAEAKTKAEAESRATAKVQAKAVIEAYAPSRIKKEEVDGWVEDALILGLEKVKSRIEALPINKTATATATAASTPAGVVDPNVVPSSAMFYQAKIMNSVKARQKTATTIL